MYPNCELIGTDFLKAIISAQPYTIHRCADVFEDPESFNPNRWLGISAEVKEKMNKAFIPFSAGQRGYVGLSPLSPLANNALAADFDLIDV
jgi:hypothetical protein